MMGPQPAHPLDVELADLVDGLVGGDRQADLEGHLAACLLCRVKVQRLRDAPPVAVTPGFIDLDHPPPAFAVPAPHDRRDPGVGDLWRAGEGLLVTVVGVVDGGERVRVAPVTFDVEAADEETVVVEAGRSPFGVGLAVYPALATEVPVDALTALLGVLGKVEGVSGTPITGPTDPRLDVRQYLADRLSALDDVAPEPQIAADAPPLALASVTSALVRDLRAWRGDACRVVPIGSWQDLTAARAAGWEPMITVDEVGVVLVVFDTPHGLVDDEDFDTARAVLTRCNATAVVVLARGVSETVDVFDAAGLSYGIETPSGHRAPPRPLIAGLAAVDAIAKFLDQSTGAKAMSLPARGAVTHVSVADILQEAVAGAVADATKQASRFKIAPKRRGYESLAGAGDALSAALGRALASEPVVEQLIDLAKRPGPGPDRA